MSSKRAFSILISSVVAAQSIGIAPALAADADAIRNLNGVLSAIATKNGMIPRFATGPAGDAGDRSSMSGQSMPTAAEVVGAVRALPGPVLYNAADPPVPTPTAQEAALLIPPVTDVSPVIVNGVETYPVFGTITQADESLTGMFEDLSNVDLGFLAPEVDQSMFSIDDLISSVLPSDATTATLSLSESMDLLEQPVAIDQSGLLIFDGQPTEMHPFDVQSTVDGGTTADRTFGVLSLPTVLCPEMAESAPEAFPNSAPVGLKLVAASGASACLITEQGAPSMLLRGSVTKNSLADGATELMSGEGFFNPHQKQTVELPNGHVLSLNANALAWVEIGDGWIKVRSGSNNVRLSTEKGHNITIDAGEEAVLVHQAFTAVDPVADGLAKRRIARHQLGGGSCVYISEFSIPHFLSKEQSFANAGMRAFRERLLKHAAAISIACRHHARYYTPVGGKMPRLAFAS
jgi:hypothetical protein